MSSVALGCSARLATLQWRSVTLTDRPGCSLGCEADRLRAIIPTLVRRDDIRDLLALAAALSTVAVPGYALSGVQSFMCVGAATAEGFPYGTQSTGRVQLSVTVTGGVVTVIDRHNGDFCATGAECASSVNSEAIAMRIRNVPHRDPLYSAAFRMDMHTKEFVHSGGGLDGGWSMKGKCKANPAEMQRSKDR